MSFISRCNQEQKNKIAHLTKQYSEELVKVFGEKYIRELGITASMDNSSFKITIHKLPRSDNKSDPISSIAKILAITELFRIKCFELKLDSDLPRNDLIPMIVYHTMQHVSEGLVLTGLKDEEIVQVSRVTNSDYQPKRLYLESCQLTLKAFEDFCLRVKPSMRTLSFKDLFIDNRLRIRSMPFTRFGSSFQWVAHSKEIRTGTELDGIIHNTGKFIDFDNACQHIIDYLNKPHSVDNQ